ncbi:MAG: orotate phosphoribosyltransferase [Ignavibacteria bacterium GWB2_35_12]|nr:MAG: orotate phosphoribosyltransferase [Ignavibacteria bacterium GWA2_35_8]OGU39743.1 MAG: orotate phosphoribosyltransferase [Ignavibacteria bacterium GWB2_35_12]OGU91231.1 MAG: orotate phosphoribosyltransferase [Ignavibacteria bacterium RIFOXYA2_FULL_35_10]OGV21366.1 MAG: orotate phosphoribosyltransferase [Ignavibacteria bacterium RIFOXYC2_FULL_35_21]
MTRKELGRAIFETSYLTGTFLLRSGKISSEYFDKYLFESIPELLEEIVKQMLPIMPKNFDMIAGLEMGGIPIATLISHKTGKPCVFVRKKSKEYGTKKLAEGEDIQGKKLLIVEDVITSGGQVILSVTDLRQRGAIVNNAVCVIDRQLGGKETLAKNNIELVHLFTMNELKV